MRMEENGREMRAKIADERVIPLFGLKIFSQISAPDGTGVELF